MQLSNAGPRPLVLLLSAILIVACVDSARAVVDLGAPSNRRIDSIVAVPSSERPAGVHEIIVTWSLVLETAGVVGDLGTVARISLSSHGREVDTAAADLVWNIRAGRAQVCDGESCGTVFVDDIERTLVCGASDAKCHGPELIGVFRDIPLDPGTEITVTLSPSPGADAEIDSHDDTYSIVFEPDSESPAGGAIP